MIFVGNTARNLYCCLGLICYCFVVAVVVVVVSLVVAAVCHLHHRNRGLNNKYIIEGVPKM